MIYEVDTVSKYLEYFSTHTLKTTFLFLFKDSNGMHCLIQIPAVITICCF